MIYEVNQLKMSGKQPSKKLDTPFFKSFRKDSVVGVGEGIIDDFPGSFMLKIFLINKNSHELNDSHGRMGIIELNTDFRWEMFPVELLTSIF